MFAKLARAGTSLNFLRTPTLIAVASLSFFLSATTWAATPIATYSIIEIPLSNACVAQANAMNNLGEVVGRTSCYSGAFFYQHSSGAVNYLTFDSAVSTTANGISDSGLIVGWAAGPDPALAVMWSRSGGVEALGSLAPGGSEIGTAAVPNAVNNGGLIVGEYSAQFLGIVPLVWIGPQHAVQQLPELECDLCNRRFAFATAVNNQGHIAGTSEFNYHTPPDFPSGTHAVEWHDGNITDLGDLGGQQGLFGVHMSAANGINNRDDIVGTSELESGLVQHAFLYHAGSMVDIGTLQGDNNSSATSINDRGEIVGWSNRAFSVIRNAFIYVNGQMYDLNKLMTPTRPLASFVHLEEAVAINSTGWIAANGTDSRDDLQHAYLLIRNATP